MELFDLTHRLAKYNPQLYGSRPGSWDLQTVRLYEENQTEFDPSVLYLTDTSLLPRPDQPGHFVIICLGPAPAWHCYSRSTFAMIYLPEAASFRSLFNALQKILTRDRRITTNMQLLVNALLSDQGLQHLTDTAGNVFGNPVYIVDLQHKYLAISSGISPNNTFFQEEHRAGYIRDEDIQSIHKNRLNEKIRKSDGPYLHTGEVNGQAMLIDILYVQGIEVGHVMVQEFDRPFHDHDAALLQYFSKLVAMELQKNSTFTMNKGVMYSYFLADLLKNSEVNTPQVRERLRLLGYNLKEDMYIMAIPPVSYHAVTVRLEVIVDQLRQIMPGSIYVVYEEVIVFLISKERYQGFSDYERDRINDFLTANHLKAGISNFFNRLSDAARFYQQALQAVNMGMRLGTPSPLYYYRDYYIYQIIETCERSDAEIRFLINPGLMNLYYSDADKGTELLITLQQYLEYPGQPARVAANLHIHKNTLLYRMNKIKEITKCDFEEGEDYMNFGFSFKIMKYLKMLD